MRAVLSQKDKIIRHLTTLTLVFWLAGFGCAVGCEMTAHAATDGASQASADTDSCPAFSGDCCHKSKDDGETTPVNTISSDKNIAFKDITFSVSTVPSNKNHPSCCPLVGLSADPARRVDGLDAPFAVAAVESPAQNVKSAHTLFTRPPRIANKGSTHLRCCVFLI